MTTPTTSAAASTSETLIYNSVASSPLKDGACSDLLVPSAVGSGAGSFQTPVLSSHPPYSNQTMDLASGYHQIHQDIRNSNINSHIHSMSHHMHHSAMSSPPAHPASASSVWYSNTHQNDPRFASEYCEFEMRAGSWHISDSYSNSMQSDFSPMFSCLHSHFCFLVAPLSPLY